MNARRAIQKAAEDLGLKIQEMIWEPIGPAAEMCGNSGGWRILDSEDRDYLGYNYAEVIEDMRRSVRWRMEAKEAERHYRRGLRNAAKVKDERIAELLAILPPDIKVNGQAGVALREFRNLTLHRFIVSLYRETHRQCVIRAWKKPPNIGLEEAEHIAAPPGELGDAWRAIGVIMESEFGEHWRDAWT